MTFERGMPPDVWVLDIQKGIVSRLTTHAGLDGFPVWSPDGRTIAYSSTRDGVTNIYRRAFGIIGPDEPVSSKTLLSSLPLAGPTMADTSFTLPRRQRGRSTYGCFRAASPSHNA